MRASLAPLLLALFAPLVQAGQDQQPERPPGEETFQAWIAQLSSELHEESSTAFRKLLENYPRSRTSLIQGTRQRDAKTRAWCIRVLSRTADPRNTPLFERPARSDVSKDVRILALRALCEDANYAAGPLLRERLVQERDRTNRLTILRWMEARRDKDSVKTILECIESGGSSEFEARAYHSLRRLTDANLPNDPASWWVWWESYVLSRKPGNEAGLESEPPASFSATEP